MIEHKHMIVRAECMKPPTEDELVVWLEELVERLGMKILSGPHSGCVTEMPGNLGPTAVVIIETSHMAVHVWTDPDPALIQLDVYTCGALDRDIVLDHLMQWHPVKHDIKVFDREYKLEEIT